MALPVGSRAPDFELTQKVGQDPVRLSTYGAGKAVVVLFFPLAFSGVCTREMCDLAGQLDLWEQTGARVLGVSVDSPWVNARFADDTGVPFPLLSDFNAEVCAAYGVRNDDFFGMHGVADRSAFVIAPDGTVTYAWTTDDSDVLPPYAEIREAARQAGRGATA